MPIGTPLDSAPAPLNVLLYGHPGTGKTTAALGMARLGKILLIDAEAGAKPRALREHGIPVENVSTWPDNPSDLTYAGLEDLALELADDHDEFIGIVVDSMSEVARRLIDAQVRSGVEKAERLGKSRDRFQVNLEDYGVTSQMMRLLLRRFRDVPLHLALTALERRDVDEDTGQVQYGPAMSPAIAIDTMGLVDIVAHTVVDTVGNQDFYIGETASLNRRRAKDRYGVLPGRMVDPTVDRMLAYINDELTKADDPRQQAARAAKAAAAE